uniref:Putative ovule protein n=1 Tax=Solanum chacoense TaxID=4108 RepID=A0A0V0HGV8_SOLCH
MPRCLTRDETIIPHDAIWIPRALRKVFFCMVGNQRSGLAAENMRKWRIRYVSWCFMCKNSREDMDHLLLHCQVASRFIVSDSEIVWTTVDYVGDDT